MILLDFEVRGREGEGARSDQLPSAPRPHRIRRAIARWLFPGMAKRLRGLEEQVAELSDPRRRRQEIEAVIFQVARQRGMALFGKGHSEGDEEPIALGGHLSDRLASDRVADAIVALREAIADHPSSPRDKASS